jgi:ABC-type sugar transport system substrate-binding protein/AraC-like DNA-binding protein
MERRRNRMDNGLDRMKGSLSPEDGIFIVWENEAKKEVPPRPRFPELFPKEDSRYWYDLEFAGIDAKKLPMPVPDAYGAKGKRVIALLPSSHPYHISMMKSMQETCDTFGMLAKFYICDENLEKFTENLRKAVEEKPDMIFINPCFFKESKAHFKFLYDHKIPVIALNMIPSEDAFPYILSWVGPDAWGESRLLGRKFAELMDREGGYAIVQHSPDNSTYYSRTWSFITELSTNFPKMRLLDKQTSYLDTKKTEHLVLDWIGKFGSQLKGIISCDDCSVLEGIVSALGKSGRDDIICVSNGSTKTGINYLKEGKVSALCLKSPIVEGATAIKAGVDWFEGLDIPPMLFLPKHIITREDVDELFLHSYEIRQISLENIYGIIRSGTEKQLKKEIRLLFSRLHMCKVLSLDSFRGFTIEFISGLLSIIKEANLNVTDFIGSYEDLFKNLFRQKSIDNTLLWLFRLALDIRSELEKKRNSTSKTDAALYYIKTHLDMQFSLKTLSTQFGLSSKTLGIEIKKKTGMKFSEYLAYLRIECAKDLLLNTSYSTIEIANKIGFSNTNYFYSVFKKYEEITPNQFRKTKR